MKLISIFRKKNVSRLKKSKYEVDTAEFNFYNLPSRYKTPALQIMELKI